MPEGITKKGDPKDKKKKPTKTNQLSHTTKQPEPFVKAEHAASKKSSPQSQTTSKVGHSTSTGNSDDSSDRGAGSFDADTGPSIAEYDYSSGCVGLPTSGGDGSSNAGAGPSDAVYESSITGAGPSNTGAGPSNAEYGVGTVQSNSGIAECSSGGWTAGISKSGSRCFASSSSNATRTSFDRDRIHYDTRRVRGATTGGLAKPIKEMVDPHIALPVTGFEFVEPYVEIGKSYERYGEPVAAMGKSSEQMVGPTCKPRGIFRDNTVASVYLRSAVVGQPGLDPPVNPTTARQRRPVPDNGSRGIMQVSVTVKNIFFFLLVAIFISVIPAIYYEKYQSCKLMFKKIIQEASTPYEALDTYAKYFGDDVDQEWKKTSIANSNSKHLLLNESKCTKTEEYQTSDLRTYLQTKLEKFDSWYEKKLRPLEVWNMEFNIRQATLVTMKLRFPWKSYLAIYGRRNIYASITQFDFGYIFRAGKMFESRLKRQSQNYELDSNNNYTTKPFSYLDKRQVLSTLPIGVTTSDPHTKIYEIISEVPKNYPTAAPKSWKNRMHSHYIMEDHHTRKKRAIVRKAPTSANIQKYLIPGTWNLLIYNDDVTRNLIEILIELHPDVNPSCINDCSKHGTCDNGKCECNDGYTGQDCSETLCPVLCSDNGVYNGGICHCNKDWKGPQCDIAIEECKLSDCSGHGKCLKGVCICNAGWKGESCDIVDCVDPKCSGHGKCVDGECYCKAGWHGVNCSEHNKDVLNCLPQCSGHGIYDSDISACKCDEMWTSADCSEPSCNMDCGPNGSCLRGKCICMENWEGEKCNLLPCDARCTQHGQCKNATCICQRGWNGKHCTIAGCGENNCNNIGECLHNGNEYFCNCTSEWGGFDCSVQLEFNCTDEIDNDGDGLVDCADPECCKEDVCKSHQLCLRSHDPHEILFKKQAGFATLTFFQRFKFLIEQNSVQSYADIDEYSERRVSVVRGQILTQQGLPLGGVRVSLYDAVKYGFTLSRDDGWYDILLNGGNGVTLQFVRSPFYEKRMTIFLPWNKVVLAPLVVMEVNEEDNNITVNITKKPFEILSQPGIQHKLKFCKDHNVSVLNPYIITTWPMEKIGGMGQDPEKENVIYLESQVLKLSVKFVPLNLNLVYRSSSASGFLSCFTVRLTNDFIPYTLEKIYVYVEVTGHVFKKVLEPDLNLTYTFSWNKRNVYKHRVHGIIPVRVFIGYQYQRCTDIIWEVFPTTVRGFEYETSVIGGWGLDEHHHFSFTDGLIQKGDGDIINVIDDYPHLVQIDMGNGLQRPLVCNDCDGFALHAKLLMPISITSGGDGSLYVGDFDLIRKITPDGTVFTILKLTPTQTSYYYYLSMSPQEQLYLSDPDRRQILRILDLFKPHDVTLNYEVVVGTGDRCVPDDFDNCGDDGPAKEAKLNHPKGIAIALNRKMYIADGATIRIVDQNGTISTIIGNHGHSSIWQRLPCFTSVEARLVKLVWPTSVVINPVDHMVYIVDDKVVVQLSHDQNVKIIAGKPSYCKDDVNYDTDDNGFQTSQRHEVREYKIKARNTPLATIRDIVFNPFGKLFIAEGSSRFKSQIRIVDLDGFIVDFAGQKYYTDLNDTCDCPYRNRTNLQQEIIEEIPQENVVIGECVCPYTPAINMSATDVKLKTINSMTVTPDGAIHIIDQETLFVLSFHHYVPSRNQNGELIIPDPKLGKLYLFDDVGNHISTLDLYTRKLLYKFSYDRVGNIGHLATVTDDSGNTVHFLRDYRGKILSVDTLPDHGMELTISEDGMLLNYSIKNTPDTIFEYSDPIGLLVSRIGGPGSLKGGSPFIFLYNELGRLKSTILPTGEIISVNTDLKLKNKHGELKTYTPLSTHVLDGKFPPNSVDVRTTKNAYSMYSLSRKYTENNIIRFRNGSFDFYSGQNEVIKCINELNNMQFEWVFMSEGFIPLSYEYVAIRGSLVNRMSWKFYLAGDLAFNSPFIQKTLFVQNYSILSVEYSAKVQNEIVRDRHQNVLMHIKYNKIGMPTILELVNCSHVVNISYDNFYRIGSFSWGNITESYEYNDYGLITRLRTRNEIYNFTYTEQNKVKSIEIANDKLFRYTYDDNYGLRNVQIPSGLLHTFSAFHLIGYTEFKYTPPTNHHPFIEHYSGTGALLKQLYPADGGQVIYRYLPNGKLSKIISGDGIIEIGYDEITGFPVVVTCQESGNNYRWEYEYTDGMLVSEWVDFDPIMGLSNSKFIYYYDDNFRMICVTGRIGGHVIPTHSYVFDEIQGRKVGFGSFVVKILDLYTITIADANAMFKRVNDEYFRLKEFYVSIHEVLVYGIKYTYDNNSRISNIVTSTQTFASGLHDAWRNYTYDKIGQLLEVQSHEPWEYEYDSDMNMLSMNYKGNKMEATYDSRKRLISFGNSEYKYNLRGYTIQNAREEKFLYNTKGQLVRAFKMGQFDVKYTYDHMGRLSSRKDNFGNATQYFYNNLNKPDQLSYMYSVRDGKLVTFQYDDQEFLIMAYNSQDRFYTITDHCGTPIIIFNQYGETIREMMRSPYGHIVYDSNPYYYMPVDYCGGIYDPATTLIHMPNGKIYDPLIGQWMTPNKEGILKRVYNPLTFNIYRFSGNDPINVNRQNHDIRDEKAWLLKLGYDIDSVAPQLRIPRNIDPFLTARSINDLSLGQIEVLSGFFNEFAEKLAIRRLTRLSAIKTAVNPKLNFFSDAGIPYHPIQNIFYPKPYTEFVQYADNLPYPAAESDSIFGHGILISKLGKDRVTVNSIYSANVIYTDVLTSVFNNTKMLPFTIGNEFYFVKRDLQKAISDEEQLNRLGSELNVTFDHIQDSNDNGEVLDGRIHRGNTVLHMRYGTNLAREKQRLLQEAKAIAVERAWEMQRHLLLLNIPTIIQWNPTIIEWTPKEVEELLSIGFVSGYDTKYAVDVQLYPELSTDPFNIRFYKVDSQADQITGYDDDNNKNA